MITSKNINVLVETGIRGISDLARRYKKARIMFHQDL